MHYDFTAITDADVPQAVEPIFQDVVTTYRSSSRSWKPRRNREGNPRQGTTFSN